nr:MAG TPA: hypothetical protein [Caudoviricetes sp.]
MPGSTPDKPPKESIILSINSNIDPKASVNQMKKSSFKRS